MNPTFDLADAHRFFSAHCFNEAWEYFEKPDRTDTDNDEMILLALSSLWHWKQRGDINDTALSIGYWQIARAYALAGELDNAARYAARCLAMSENLPPFYKAYAHEAAAVAALLSDDHDSVAYHLDAARTLAAQVAEPDERAALEKDLAALEPDPATGA